MLIYAAAIVMLCLTGQSLRLGHQVSLSLEGLATAQTDTLQWTLSQVEVDHLKYRNLVKEAQLAPEAEVNLNTLRRAFDIYYSRLITITESEIYSKVRTDKIRAILDGLTHNLLAQTPLIDSSDAELRSRLNELETLIRSDNSDVRELALQGVALQIEMTGAKRNHLHGLYARLGVVLTLLVLAMLTTVLFLARLYQRGQILMAQNTQSAARMRTMISASLDAIVMVDSQGAIVAANGAAEKLLGVAPGQAKGLALERLLPELSNYLSARGSNWLARLELPCSRTEGRIRMTGVPLTGEPFPAELSLSVSQSGRNAVLVGYIRDISSRLQAEEQLRQARDDALAGERAKDHLLTVMSHEMRTPLNGILGALDLLNSTALNDQQHRFVEAMRVSGDILLHHVNDVLELSRLESGAEPETERVFDLNALVNGLVESQQAQAGRNNNDLSAFCSLGPREGVLGQQRALQQALLNLVGNALKFTENGAVSIDVMRLDETRVEFSVADTGKGIAKEDYDRIFDDFTMLDPSYRRGAEGTGLGLAITRRLVAGMGGEVRCESELGEGSIFSFNIPLPARLVEAPVEEKQASPSARARRILLIEDNDINRMLVESMLSKLGHVVVTAAGGGVGLAEMQATQFDLIISDISMPDIDGLEVLRRARADGLAEGIPIVALTAHASADNRKRFLEAGFAEVLTKPVNRENLSAMIARQTPSEPNWIDDGPSPSKQPTEDRALSDSDIAQFVAAVGAEKAQVFLDDFRAEVVQLTVSLEESGDLTEGLRQEAHRLAGSAAVLGFGDLRRCMLDIEMADEGAVPQLAPLQEAWESAENVMVRYFAA